MPLPILSVPKYTATLSDGTDIQYRPYLIKEEKIMLMALEATDIKTKISAVLDLVEACTFNKLDAEKASLADIMLLIIKIRAKSVGETARFKLKCQNPDCGEYHETSLDLSEVTTSKRANESNSIQLTDEAGITLRMPTVAEEMQLDLKDIPLADKAIESIAIHIESVFTKEETTNRKDVTHDELVDFVLSFNKNQLQQIREWVAGEPTICEELDFTCGKCETENKIELKGFNDFFA
jgi:hypothetical protein